MTTDIVKKYGVICTPKYYMRQQLANQFFDVQSDVSWRQFLHKLHYKSYWYGREFYELKLEREERKASDSELADLLYFRVTKCTSLADRYKLRTVGATEISLPYEKESINEYCGSSRNDRITNYLIVN